MTEMHKVAESTAVAFVGLILTTACFTEIRDWRQLCKKRPLVVPPVIEGIDGSLRFFFPLVASIYVADEVFAYIIAYVHLDELAEFGQFAKEVFVEVVELILQIVVAQFAFRVEVAWVLVYIADEDRL